MESWKDISNYETLYEVSTLGNVRRKGSVNNLKPGMNKNGYKHISLCKDGKPKTKMIHRLVAETYIEMDCKRPQVNHKNGIKSDNRLENLEWCSKSENMRHAYVLGLIKRPYDNTYRRILSEEQVVEIKMRLCNGDKQKDIAIDYGVHRTTIGKIKSGDNWCNV